MPCYSSLRLSTVICCFMPFQDATATFVSVRAGRVLRRPSFLPLMLTRMGRRRTGLSRACRISLICALVVVRLVRRAHMWAKQCMAQADPAKTESGFRPANAAVSMPLTNQRLPLTSHLPPAQSLARRLLLRRLWRGRVEMFFQEFFHGAVKIEPILLVMKSVAFVRLYHVFHCDTSLF
jgi:hypothetical protein